MSDKRVAIIIVTYNGSDFIGDCLSSLEKMIYGKDSYEIIVVDNDSQDKSREIIKKQEARSKKDRIKLRVFLNKENVGFAEGNNIGIRYALKKGFDYVYLLNQDTEAEPNFLVRALEVAEENKKIGSVQSRLMYFDNRDVINSLGGVIHFLGFGFTRGNKERFTAFDLRRSMSTIAYPSGAGVLIRCSLIEEIGMFEKEFFAYYEDADLGWRITLAGYENRIAYDSVVYHKYDFNRSIQRYFLLERNRYLLILRNYKWATLVLFSPGIFFWEFLALLKSVLTLKLHQRFRIYGYFLRLETWKKILYSRNVLKKTRLVSDRKIVGLFTGKIEYQENSNLVMNVFINPIFTLYFYIFRYFIFW